jgi:hypothetical protein
MPPGLSSQNDLLLFSELASYHSEHAGSLEAAYATYLISGEPHVSYLDSVRDKDEMAVDEETMDDGSEDVPETKITLVGEYGLESAVPFYSASSATDIFIRLKRTICAHSFHSHL